MLLSSSTESDKYFSFLHLGLSTRGSPESDDLNMLLFTNYNVNLFTLSAIIYINTSSQEEEEIKCSKMELMLKANK